MAWTNEMWSTPHRGLIAIAATRSPPREGREAMRREPFVSVLQHHGIDFGADCSTNGRIVAVAELVSCAPTNGDFVGACYWPPGMIVGKHEKDFGDYSAGRWAWFLREIHSLRWVRAPYWKGRQGLRAPDERDGNIVARLRTEIGA